VASDMGKINGHLMALFQHYESAFVDPTLFVFEQTSALKTGELLSGFWHADGSFKRINV
jgi:hypothetical protein